MESKEVSLTDLMKYFNMTAGEFAKEWKRLTDKEKDEFREMYAELKTGRGQIEGQGLKAMAPSRGGGPRPQGK